MAEDRYEIRIGESLSGEWGDWFGDMTVTPDAAGGSVLTGAVPDQAALHGLLARIRDLNLTLISVTSLPELLHPPGRGPPFDRRIISREE